MNDLGTVMAETGKQNFTSDEWALLARSPFMTGLIVTLAAPSGISGILEESSAITQNLLMSRQTQSTIIAALVTDIQNSKGQLAQPNLKLSAKNAAEIALGQLEEVAQLLQLKTNQDQAKVFKEWLLLIAQDTAQAAKEGGLFGLGGVQVNEAEERALQQIRTTLVL